MIGNVIYFLIIMLIILSICFIAFFINSSSEIKKLNNIILQLRQDKNELNDELCIIKHKLAHLKHVKWKENNQLD